MVGFAAPIPLDQVQAGETHVASRLPCHARFNLWREGTLMLSRSVFRIFSIATLLLVTCLLAVPARAGTISIDYSFTGGLIPPPVISGGFVDVNGAGAGSVSQWNPLLNAVWNPVTF